MSPEDRMRRHFIDTEVWRDGKRGVVTNIDHPSGTICVDWGGNEPEWLTRGTIRALRTAHTRAHRCTCVCTCGAHGTPKPHL